MRKTSLTLTALASAGLLLTTALPVSTASPQTSPASGANTAAALHRKAPKLRTVAKHLAGPLSFVAARGAIYVGQSGSGTLSRVRPGRAIKDVVVRPGLDVAAVSVRGNTLTWAEMTIINGEPTESILARRTGNGKVRTVANLFAYERKHNPDGKLTYGLRGLSKTCAAQIPPALAEDVAPHKGIIDSHPYGSVTKGAYTYVADAGSNALLRVSRSGRVSTVAVLPAATFKMTREVAAGFGLPDCTVGLTFALESVPTDVEVGPHGYLYVTTLPGGPEDGSLGALGSVYRVNPRTGAVKRVATGFSGATGLAIGHRGTIYVAELFGNRVSTVTAKGKVKKLMTLNQPAAIEYRRGTLYVSTDVFGDGKIVAKRVR